MKFERDSRNRRTATFEVEPESGFHEQFIAMSALGLLTVQNRASEQRLTTARLAVRLDKQSMRGDVDGEQKLQATSSPLSVPEAKILHGALNEFRLAAPGAILAVAMGGPHSANIRAVEDDVAEGMIKALTAEFRLKSLVAPRPFGFH